METEALFASVQGWELPGHGAARPACGEVITRGCDDVASHPNGMVVLKRIRLSCGKKECPVCWEDWAHLEAEKIAHRFKHSKARYPIHVVVSPPMKEWDLPFSKLRRRAYDIARAAGLKGGVVMFHPFRWRCANCGRDDEACACPIKKGYWYSSPHFHAIGIGWIQGVPGLHSRTGWIVKNLGGRDRDIKATAFYLLTHTGVRRREGIQPSTNSITWFGVLSFSKLHGIPPYQRPKLVCPLCGGPLEVISFIDDPGGLEETGLYFISWEKYTQALYGMPSFGTFGGGLVLSASAPHGVADFTRVCQTSTKNANHAESATTKGFGEGVRYVLPWEGDPGQGGGEKSGEM